jgi:SAM-dependent methyltransferase
MTITVPPLWEAEDVPPVRALNWKEWAELMRGIDETETRWRRGPARPATWVINPGECAGWFPYPPADFIAMLAEAMPAAQGPRFLDVGCGPGTKLRLARAMFSLDVAGLEIAPEMAAAAREAGLKVAENDARSWMGYGAADIIFMNRPVVPLGNLERHIMRLMKPGAILMSVNGTTSPGQSMGWPVVSEEYGAGAVNGIWAKPEKTDDVPEVTLAPPGKPVVTAAPEALS